MDGAEILRIIDALHRDKDIDKEYLFQSLEFALASAARKKLDAGDELVVHIDRKSGKVEAFRGDQAVELVDLGRIGAQVAKQVMIQRHREAEQDVVLNQFQEKVDQLVTGTVQRIEMGNYIINLGKIEGILPRSEVVRGEIYNVGDRVKALITEVKKDRLRVRIILSRTSPTLVRRLFEVEVPEIADGVIEIRRVAREPGYRTKIAVASADMRVDCIGACVGIRGTRIKAITEELNNEKIDIIRWNESVEALILNALRPAEIADIKLDAEKSVATVRVTEDQLSLAIGRRGQNVRLASRLTGWEINLEAIRADGSVVPPGEVGSPGVPAPPPAERPDAPAASTAPADDGGGAAPAGDSAGAAS
ncbi:MAG: transcription termination factor NusA [Planctomycetes bacterium]|nr:transcription termination factor NusA [Planctomycetota bacterium]